MELIEEGTVIGRAISARWQTSSGGHDCLEVNLELLKGKDEGRTVCMWLYFTEEENSEVSVETLLKFGCTFPNDDIRDLTGLGNNTVLLTIKHEEWQGKMRARVTWVEKFEGLSDERLSSLSERLGRAVAAAKQRHKIAADADSGIQF